MSAQNRVVHAPRTPKLTPVGPVTLAVAAALFCGCGIDTGAEPAAEEQAIVGGVQSTTKKVDDIDAASTKPADARLFRTRVSLPYRDIPVIASEPEAVFGAEELNRRIGDPRLPIVNLTFQLPDNAELDGLEVVIRDTTEIELPDTVEVAPVLPPVFGEGPEWPRDRAFVDGKSVEVYGRDAYYPAEVLGEVRTSGLRQHKLVDVTFFPYRYNPVTKRLKQLTGGELVVSCPLADARTLSATRYPASRIAERFLAEHTVNHDAVARFTARGAASAEAPAAPTANYVIVTTEAIRTASAQLAAFVAAKERLGFTVLVATESTWGGGTGDVAANRIRQWLKTSYLDLGVEYVLLIGNPDTAAGDVPMKMTWPRNNTPFYDQFKEAPSDFFYADLTGDWDTDGDGFAGEGDDDATRPGGPDGYAEVMVGRIPFYGSMVDLDSILSRSIAYGEEASPEAWRRKALLPMVPSDPMTPGFHLGEAIKDDILVPSGWSYHRIYNTHNQHAGNQPIIGVPTVESMPCNETNVFNAWSASPFGLVVWWTHGSETAAVDVLNSSLAATLPDARSAQPAFTFQVSCFNAKPERADNLAYTLLLRGAVAATAATRVSWYQPGETTFTATDSNAGMGYRFARALVRDHLAVGAALAMSKAGAYSGSALWMNYVVFNTYGDPSLQIIPSPAATPELACNAPPQLSNIRVGSHIPFDITCYNTGAGELTLTSATSDQSWLVAAVSSPRSVRVDVDATELQVGTSYNASVVVESNGGTQTVPIAFRVLPRYLSSLSNVTTLHLAGQAFNNWSPASAAHEVVLVQDYTWELRVDVPQPLERTPYKITANGSWDVNWGGGSRTETMLFNGSGNATVSLESGAYILRLNEMIDHPALFAQWIPRDGFVWAGNVAQQPEDGRVTSNDDLWVSAETARPGTVDGASSKAFFRTNAAPAWQMRRLERVVQNDGRDSWRANLGRFPVGTSVTYRFEMVGVEGNVITLDNDGAGYVTTVVEQAPWTRTVVLIYGETVTGQDMFIRGGIDHTYAKDNLGLDCTAANYACAIPIRFRNTLNATTAPWKAGDTYLDWYGIEAGQGARAEGSALDWTTNRWPAEWGAKRTVEVDGYGETPLNQWGHHYWLLDVDMDCSKSVNGWFELKSYISNGPGWEGNVTQPGAPYASNNHFARCGSINVFRRGESTPVMINPL